MLVVLSSLVIILREGHNNDNMLWKLLEFLEKEECCMYYVLKYLYSSREQALFAVSSLI